MEAKFRARVKAKNKRYCCGDCKMGNSGLPELCKSCCDLNIGTRDDDPRWFPEKLMSYDNRKKDSDEEQEALSGKI